MFLMLLWCISADCNGAMFSTERPLTIITASESECVAVGHEKLKILHALPHQRKFEYGFTCMQALNPPGATDTPVL